MSLKQRTRLAIAAAAMMALTLAGAASAHPHTAGPKDQALANGQNHGTYVSGVSCGGDPAAYGLESAHHGPDAGTPGKADGCYRTTGGVRPGLDDENPAID
ncbi:MAG: hypothetical protein H0W22_04145 [Chloroflexi bacterium]|nr:hypothetical protein [Chloroflexota bacterium]